MKLAPSLLALASAAAIVGLVSVRVAAHKPVTSRYDYDKDVLPILRAYCADCHVAGGPAPMSLMTYEAAVPWAESIRDELTTGRMPPWPVDASSPAIKGRRPISSREIDVLVTWASGGTPPGSLPTKLPEMTFTPRWKLGPPDLSIPMDAVHTVLAGTFDEICDFSLPTNLSEARWVSAVDLMPGTPSIVRDAIVTVENGPLLALWEPGDDPTRAPSGTGFRLAPGSTIHLQIHYRKHFDQEQEAVSDRSAIGLYFTDAPLSRQPIASLVIEPSVTGDDSATQTLSASVPVGARIVGLRPMLNTPYQSVTVDAETPDGNRVPLLALREPRPAWFRRYWLQDPVDVAPGTRINIRVTPLPHGGDEPQAPRRFPLQILLDYVSH